MTHKTRGIVLKTVKYGETSIVVTILTELFGVQTYMVNGVRTTGKSGSKALLYQPAAILDLEVYHNDLKLMHRIKEASWSIVYKNLLSDVIKNSIALYMVELIYKSVKQPEQNTDLFYYCEDSLIKLDVAERYISANFPLYFALHLPYFFGFRISTDTDFEYKQDELYLDLIDGVFSYEQPAHPHFIHGENALLTSELLKIMQIHELSQIKLNGEKRRDLLLKYQEYYSLHIQDFGTMKTLQVLHEILT